MGCKTDPDSLTVSRVLTISGPLFGGLPSFAEHVTRLAIGKRGGGAEAMQGPGWSGKAEATATRDIGRKPRLATRQRKILSPGERSCKSALITWDPLNVCLISVYYKSGGEKELRRGWDFGRPHCPTRHSASPPDWSVLVASLLSIPLH